MELSVRFWLFLATNALDRWFHRPARALADIRFHLEELVNSMRKFSFGASLVLLSTGLMLAGCASDKPVHEAPPPVATNEAPPSSGLW